MRDGNEFEVILGQIVAKSNNYQAVCRTGPETGG